MPYIISIRVFERKSISYLAGDVTALVGFEGYDMGLEGIVASVEYPLENRPLFGP